MQALAPRRPGLNPTPTVTISNTQMASSTFHAAAASGAPVTSKYLFLGGPYYAHGSAFPNSNLARDLPIQASVAGFGNCCVEFWSDAPSLQIWHQLTQGGAVKVWIDNVQQYHCSINQRAATAQAGGASTITLDSGASASNDFYRTRWVRIISGTGIGQVRQIISYVGSTKVATVNQAWSTAPDNTSAFEITLVRADNSTNTGTGGNANYVTFDFSGERRLRHYRVEQQGVAFNGVYVPSVIDSVIPALPSLGTPTLWFGDSFSAGTGTEGVFESLAGICCAELGWQLVNRSIGGFGYLAPASHASATTMTFLDRVFPPANGWMLFNTNATAGTFTLTQGAVTTAAIAFNASVATVQSALDTAFGSGLFEVYGITAASQMWIIGRGAKATDTSTMSADFTSQTGGLRQLVRWAGDLDMCVPRDGNGAALPFNVVLAMGHNDTVSSGFTRSALISTVSTVLTTIIARYPMARIFMVGAMYLPPSGATGSDITNMAADLLTAATAHLPMINGVLPFVDTLSWFTGGAGYLGNTVGTGNTDVCTHTDGIHPAPLGHSIYGRRLAQQFAAILAKQTV